ncbi:hypothetical protein CEXT_568471 [Caerostris extrusa]|uniref:Uncharacterized protein n=1 Tax=Caerostris extrusa TaxID=172846 RepID=A0AAV4YEG5_CAEEX|nr:hypothetical protein CEXT_568471 [Caerostris extrusa]
MDGQYTVGTQASQLRIPDENLKHLKTLELKTNHERRMAPRTFRQSRHLEKKSGSFTPRLARVPLSVCLRWERTTPFGHSITAPN